MKVKNLFAMLFAATALIACNNEDEAVSIDTGEKAWMNLSISLTNPTTRAADSNDANAEDVETAVDNIYVYLEYDGAQTGYEEIAALNKSAFTGPTAGANNTIEYTSTSAVPVTRKAGENCRLFVVINRPDGFNANDITNKIYTGDITVLAQAGKFTMFNSEETFAKLYATKDEAEAVAGRSKVSMERLAAKALLTTSLDFTQPVPDANLSGSTGTFVANSLKWRIRNSNTKMFFIKENDYKSPNWEYIAGTTVFTDYTKYPWNTTLIDVPAQATAPATGYKDDGTALVQYFTENTNQTYVYGNTTQMAIQAHFIPSAIATAYTAPANPGEAPTWTIDDANTTQQTFFYAPKEKKYMTEAAKTSFLADNADAEVWGPYDNGACYYYVSIGKTPLDDANLGAKRNHYYKANVKSLIAPGMPGEPTDENEKVNPDAVWIAVDLVIEPWNMVSMGDLDLK
jgi:hypothetical protein